ncbi:MAG: ROK family protein [Ruminococcaceae bacterium]|nr:ROK family protein [Oscillospiraceae bacterium]
MLIGIDIGGTKCAVIKGEVENDEIKIVNKIKIDTKNISPEGALKLFKEKIIEISNGESIDAIGISCGGPLDSKNGIIMSPPNLLGWDNIKIVDYMKNAFGCACAIQNDANACALAEWKFGAAKGYNNVVFFTFGSGLGAGLILDGKLYSGTNDMAGEAGHIRLCDFGPVGYGKAGSFEGFCSGNGIAKLGALKATEALQNGKTVSYCTSFDDLDNITAKKIAEFANKGYEDAKEIYAISAEKLGYGLSIIIDILNPEIIVIGSVFARNYDLMHPIARKIIDKEALGHSSKVCKVVGAALGEEIGDWAALAVAKNAIDN